MDIEAFLSFTRVCIIGMEKGDKHLMGFAKHKPNQAKGILFVWEKRGSPK
jgi:hypothetical protein